MSESRKPEEIEVNQDDGNAPELQSRREFLRGLGRWSAIIIGGAVIGGIIEPTDAAGWVNGGGGAAWVNARGGGGAAWVNGGGGGAGWVNRSGGWINGGGGGGGWVNARGGGGSWVNRY